MRRIGYAIDALCFVALAGVSVLVMIVGLAASPYFVWKFWREGRGRRTV